MTKIVLITGATSGLGAAIARKFAENGDHLILTGRREDRLDSITRELIKTYHVEILPLVFDVRKLKEVEDALEILPENWRNIDVLINNAGLAVGLNPIHEGVIDDWERMIDTNVKGLLYMTRVFAPLMVARKKGHIINIGSIAGKEVYPNGNVYCGSKFAVDAISKAMRIDLLPHHIKVTQVAPGALYTEFSLVRFKGDEARAEAVYNGFRPLIASDVADVVYYVTTLPGHVNINDLVIMPTAQASSMHFNRQ
ncbi:MAG: SDR family NAD(P)-dependent oxidoreductase [Bacteroidales bacterium]|nr:SDR family NAD(P)-dependent oxidoreductase [Bacteroidales bacterium]HNW72410.1 SDR family NAD(P)-dependent oxidoreductase [Bacteroidales bacterium]HPS49465.1 SDR family NAD(P)-dependent oxidoreductase [Bacteroidales bacterium]